MRSPSPHPWLPLVLALGVALLWSPPATPQDLGTFGPEGQTVTVPRGKKDLLDGGVTGETLELEAYGVAVIQL